MAPDLVRSEGKNDKLEVEATVNSLMGDDEADIVEEQIEECQWQKGKDHSLAQCGTPQLRGGSGDLCDNRPRCESNSFEQRCSGKPAGLSAGEGRVLAEARIENEEVRSPADRRSSGIERRSLSRILQESGTCSCQPRSGARHRHSALIARGEVQNETPSLYNKQAAAFSFSHSCECVHRQCHQCTQQHDHTPSGNRCTCEQLTMHMRVRTYRCAHAPVTQRTWHLEANCLSSSAYTSYSTAASDSCCCWGSSA